MGGDAAGILGDVVAFVAVLGRGAAAGGVFCFGDGCFGDGPFLVIIGGASFTKAGVGGCGGARTRGALFALLAATGGPAAGVALLLAKSSRRAIVKGSTGGGGIIGGVVADI
jgi:hypothetical protein